VGRSPLCAHVTRHNALDLLSPPSFHRRMDRYYAGGEEVLTVFSSLLRELLGHLLDKAGALKEQAGFPLCLGEVSQLPFCSLSRPVVPSNMSSSDAEERAKGWFYRLLSHLPLDPHSLPDPCLDALKEMACLDVFAPCNHGDVAAACKWICGKLDSCAESLEDVCRWRYEDCDVYCDPYGLSSPSPSALVGAGFYLYLQLSLFPVLSYFISCILSVD